MIDTSAIAIGLTGAAFLVGSLAPVALESREAPPAQQVPQVQAAAVSSKGDRLAVPSRRVDRTTVSTIEVIGLTQATVVFKDRNGAVLFQADSMTGTTTVARDVDLPVVTLKEEPAPAPVVQRPAPKQEGSNPPAPQGRKTRTVGCEAALSTLVRNEASSVPGMCLT